MRARALLAMAHVFRDRDWRFSLRASRLFVDGDGGFNLRAARLVCPEHPWTIPRLRGAEWREIDPRRLRSGSCSTVLPVTEVLIAELARIWPTELSRVLDYLDSWGLARLWRVGRLVLPRERQ